MTMTSNRGIRYLLIKLFPDTESLEDDFKHLFRRTRARQLVEASSRFMELGDHQLLRLACMGIGPGACDGGVRPAHQRGVPHVRDAGSITQRVASRAHNE